MRAALTAALVVSLATPAFAQAPLDVTPANSAVIVGYHPGEAFVAADAVTDLGGSVEEVAAREGVLLVDAPSPRDAEAFAARIADEEGVRFAEVVQPVYALVDDPLFAEQWNVKRVGATAGWNVTIGTADVVVAVVDSGVDSTHPDLVGRVDVARGRDFISGTADASDRYGHGTHVAGIIAANTGNGIAIAGIAPGVTILPIRVLGDTGNGDTYKLSRGIRYAADQGAEVINLSVGFVGADPMVEEAVLYAESRGCLVVAASGNRGTVGLDYPAAYPSVLAVGATDATNSRASFSQFGAELDLMAPGVTTMQPTPQGILSLAPVTGPASTGSSTARNAGTSMAAPHVSAAAALVRSLHPAWTPVTVKNRLAATAQDLAEPGKDAMTGYGLVRIDVALGASGTGTSDDSLPGTPIPGSPIVQMIDSLADPIDVFSLDLEAGEELSVGLTGTAGAVTQVSLLAPGATLMGSPLLSASSTGPASQASWKHTTVEPGTYRVVVRALRGGGDYRLSWERGFRTRLSATAPSTSRWGGSATIRGVLSRVMTGAGVAGAKIVVDERRWGTSTWKRAVATGVTDAAGAFKVSVRPKMRTSYRIRYRGAARAFAATSLKRTITPRAYLTRPAPQSPVRRGVMFNARGTLKPEHRTGAKTVELTVHRRVGDSWKYHRTVYARNLDRRGYTRYSAWMTLRTRGRYRLVAAVPGDSKHAATRSRAVYVTVR